MKFATIVISAILSAAVLPSNVLLDLGAVRAVFPAVTHLAQTGRDATAQGNPTATRSVFYEDASGSKRVTISVDRYAGAGDAASAFTTALHKSEVVPGAKPIAVPNLAQQTFAGTVTMNGETHVGMGVLSGKLVVGATLAGFTSSKTNVANLVALMRAQLARLAH